MNAINTGFMQREIQEAAYQMQLAIEKVMMLWWV